MGKINRRVIFESAALAVTMLVFLSSYVGTVAASSPVVVSVVNTSVVPNATIEVTTSHQLNINQPIGSTHMVDMVEVDFKGAVTDYPVQLSQQYDATLHRDIDPFTIDLTIGSLQANEAPIVKVRAHCNVDGWGAWSDAVTLPEFNFLASTPIIFAALVGSLLAIRIVRLSKPRQA